MGCPIKIGCEEFIFIINNVARIGEGKRFCTFWSLKFPFLGCPIKIGCEEFIFIINIETRLDLGKKSCTFMIFKLDFQLRPFWS